jgi:hypothetical protein
MHAVKPPNAGKGRKPGARNKTTAAVKDAILHAFDAVGGTSYLAEVARKDHKTFCALLGRILPRSLTDEAGEEGGNVVVEIVRFSDPPSLSSRADERARQRGDAYDLWQPSRTGSSQTR